MHVYACRHGRVVTLSHADSRMSGSWYGTCTGTPFLGVGVGVGVGVVGVAHVYRGQDCRCSVRMQIAMLRHMDADCNAKAYLIRYRDAASLLFDQPVWRQR